MMTDFKIRFNTEHNGSDFKWRVLIDNTEHVAKNIKINCPCSTTEDNVISKEVNVIKHHISCQSKNWSWSDDKILTIN